MRRELNDSWNLVEMPLDCKSERKAFEEYEAGRGYACELPCDIHMPLEKYGKIKDPVVADYCYDAEWTEKRSWWFFREFEADGEMTDADRCVLRIGAIDTHAEIFVNGIPVGTSDSVHIPFECDVLPFLRRGINQLSVRVTTGLEMITDSDLSEINWAVSDESPNGYTDRGDTRRAFVRRPQYSTGWDWCPRIATCGITGDVCLETENGVVVRDVCVRTLEIGDPARLCVTVKLESLDYIGTRDGSLTVLLKKDGKIVACEERYDLLFPSGYSYHTFYLNVPDPELWWPNGMGKQPLYTVSVSASAAGKDAAYPDFRIGIRQICLDTSRRENGSRRFCLTVNGAECFCKGANWIPCDSVYARVSDEKRLLYIVNAAKAGFNMLRIWGGGVYERDSFYELCDRYGILIWQDFMHACAALPEHRREFRELCEREYDYRTRALRNHACIALFCGNNENAFNFNPIEHPNWNLPFSQSRQFGYSLSNRIASEAVQRNCPHIPFWNSSPYGGSLPNDCLCGDVHHWDSCMMNPDMSIRTDPFVYDSLRGSFISEYGYPGPPCIESIHDYCGSDETDTGSNIWRIHTNTFEKDTVSAGIRRHYREPDGLRLEEYVLYAGMAQGLMLGYSLQSFRFRTDCGGSLFWMYDDSWGEIGWSVIDYYCRRKISYYAVRRALSSVAAIIRKTEDGLVSVMIANDTGDEISGNARLGYLSADGKHDGTETISYIAPPHSRSIVCTYRLENEDLRKGFIVFIPESGNMLPAYLYCMEYRSLELPEAILESSYCDDGEDLLITVGSKTFAHGIYSDDIRSADDLYFDLLPGQTRTVRVYGAAGSRPVMKSIAVEKLKRQGDWVK